MNQPTYDDVVMATLKERYFRLVAQEKYPTTPQITEMADNLEAAIIDLQSRRVANPT